jgi:OFA family oxalate/formate antiporter-like MFS transporter
VREIAQLDRSPAAAQTYAGRWRQLVCGIFCMVMIANLQYGWTLFVHPIDQKFHWGTTAIQIAFSVFIATETWLVPIEGWFVDPFWPADRRSRRRCLRGMRLDA